MKLHTRQSAENYHRNWAAGLSFATVDYLHNVLLLWVQANQQRAEGSIS